MPNAGERLLYCDHIDENGEALFRLACEHDLEGIVAKRKSDPYLPEDAKWLKIRNQNYSQWSDARNYSSASVAAILISGLGCLRFGVGDSGRPQIKESESNPALALQSPSCNC